MNRLSLDITPQVYTRRNASVQESLDLVLTIEMHNTYWSDEFKKYQCRDLCIGGKLYENPDILTETSDKIKYQILIGNYIVSPLPYTYYRERDAGLSGYVYVHDTADGMRIGYQAGEVRQRTKTRR